MATLLKQKQVLNSTVQTARATVLIDLGNGEVNAMCRMPGTAKWITTQFPSHVTLTPDSNSDCLTLATAAGLKNFLVGEYAKAHPCSRTGSSAEGKVTNARALLIHALRQLIGVSSETIHADVIFTSPSVKAYGPQIVEQLLGKHLFNIPADAEVIGSYTTAHSVQIHSAIPQLEGYQAFKHIQSKVKGSAYLIDIGNRTILLTQVSETGRILKRRAFDACGVYNLAERIVERDSLAPTLKTPSPQRVIDYLLDEPHGAEVIARIAPDVAACVGEVLEAIEDDSARYIMGGGAKLPGIEATLNGKTVKNPQWANLTALADAAEQLLARVQR
jgi:hypothetical protein